MASLFDARAHQTTISIRNVFMLHWNAADLAAGLYDFGAQQIIADFQSGQYIHNLCQTIHNLGLTAVKEAAYIDEIRNGKTAANGVIVTRVSLQITNDINDIKRIVEYESKLELNVRHTGMSRPTAEPNIDYMETLPAGASICGGVMNPTYLLKEEIQHTNSVAMQAIKASGVNKIPSLHFVAYYELLDVAGTIIAKIPYIAIGMSTFIGYLIIDGICALKMYIELFSLFGFAYYRAFAFNTYENPWFKGLALSALADPYETYLKAGFYAPTVEELRKHPVFGILEGKYVLGTHYETQGKQGVLKRQNTGPTYRLLEKDNFNEPFVWPLLNIEESIIAQTLNNRRQIKMLGVLSRFNEPTPTPRLFSTLLHHKAIEHRITERGLTARRNRSKKHNENRHPAIVNGELPAIVDGVLKDDKFFFDTNTGEGWGITKRKNPKNKSKKRKQMTNQKKENKCRAKDKCRNKHKD